MIIGEFKKSAGPHGFHLVLTATKFPPGNSLGSPFEMELNLEIHSREILLRSWDFDGEEEAMKTFKEVQEALTEFSKILNYRRRE